jgi:hypothetical protein
MLERSHPADLLFHADWLANRDDNSDRAYSIDRLRELVRNRPNSISYLPFS